MVEKSMNGTTGGQRLISNALPQTIAAINEAYLEVDDLMFNNTHGGGVDTPEEHAHLGTLDVNCGFAGGVGMAVALYHHLKTGVACRARTSLSAVTNLAQLPFCFDYAGLEPFNEPSGRGAMGSHALSHFYKTWDDWIFIDSSEAELERLETTVPGLQGITLTGDIQTFLTVAFQQASSEEWVKRFIAADIAAAQPQSIETLRAQYSREADGFVGTDLGSFAFSIDANHPSGHCLTQIDHYAIRPTNSLIRSVSPAQRHGQSTREILASVNYSEAEIARMIEHKVASLGWTDEHLPSDHGEQSFAVATARISMGQAADLLTDMDDDPGLIV